MADGADGSEPRIVVGVDGSDSSVLALRWAAHYAELLDATLEAVGAWEYPPTFGWAAIAPDWNPAEDVKKVLSDSSHAAFGDQVPAGTTFHVREGGAAMVLLEASHGATMLVVGSRGHGGFAGLLLGSVSANVAEHAPCPVLIVHGTKGPPAPAGRDVAAQ
jgi:nucleotide-binding universal stress UspA family protein